MRFAPPEPKAVLLLGAEEPEACGWAPEAEVKLGTPPPKPPGKLKPLEPELKPDPPHTPNPEAAAGVADPAPPIGKILGVEAAGFTPKPKTLVAGAAVDEGKAGAAVDEGKAGEKGNPNCEVTGGA